MLLEDPKPHIVNNLKVNISCSGFSFFLFLIWFYFLILFFLLWLFYWWFYCQPCQGELCLIFLSPHLVWWCAHLCFSEVLWCLFAAVSAGHWEHDKTVNNRGYCLPLQLFLSSDNVQIKKKKKSFIFSILQLVRNSPRGFVFGFFFFLTKQFNLAVGEGRCSVEALVQSLQSKVIGCFCSVSNNKSCITRRANQAFFSKCCIVPQKHASSDWQ